MKTNYEDTLNNIVNLLENSSKLTPPLHVYIKTMEDTLDIFFSEIIDQLPRKKKLAIEHLLLSLAFFQSDPNIRKKERNLLNEEQIIREVKKTLELLK